ncbi:hypothetical protein GA0070216_108159 [Micromonospora matsumotoense]|uniref:Uncharacterized protein n=1 Tax=Micromonospora matsumotoense TaxID=121616 RepID=A0A1C4Z4U0_9ACTN|nr:hypothetical protein [Micromonospora matsumotoense]SCF28062.1 hypothetical protein GA0070216_108159 [Micromonospora matsumotoense]
MTHPDTDAYLDELRTALELRDASDHQTADIIRQTRSHLIDTGEDPYEAFGDPRDYAKQYAPHSTPVRFWALIIGSVILATTGGWLLTNGIINLVGGNTVLWGLPPVVGIIVGSLLIVTWMAALVTVGVRHARQRRIRN